MNLRFKLIIKLPNKPRTLLLYYCKEESMKNIILFMGVRRGMGAFLCKGRKTISFITHTYAYFNLPIYYFLG